MTDNDSKNEIDTTGNQAAPKEDTQSEFTKKDALITVWIIVGAGVLLYLAYKAIMASMGVISAVLIFLLALVVIGATQFFIYRIVRFFSAFIIGLTPLIASGVFCWAYKSEYINGFWACLLILILTGIIIGISTVSLMPFCPDFISDILDEKKRDKSEVGIAQEGMD